MFDLSVIIVNWNTRRLLEDCLRSVVKALDGLSAETIVVDNNSADGSQAMLQDRFPQVRLIQNHGNVGFAKANNQGMSASNGRYMLLLNTDALLVSDAVRSMMSLAEQEPKLGLVGAHLLNTDGTFQASHTCFPTLGQEFLILSGLGRLLFGPWYPSHGPEEERGPQIVDYVEGACMLVRRETVEQAGGLDEGFFMYAEEGDWCYTIRDSGWEVWYHPAAKVIHLGGGSSRNRPTQREGDLYYSRVRFFRKRYGDRSARLLKMQIYCFSAVKVVAHGLLRLISGGRYGRRVVPLSHLIAKLREV